MTDIREKLCQLGTLDREIEDHRLEKKARIDDLFTDEMKKQLAEINEYYEKVFANLQQFVNRITTEIKSEVLKVGESVRSDTYQAVYAKGKTTWDTEGLNGYALAHPEIESLRNVGKASVSIRKK